jgi:hypothetical protein
MIRIPHHDALPEASLQRLVLARLNELPGVRAWRSNAGGARDGASGRVLKFGTPGQADLTGLLGPSGRRLEVELKAERGRQTPEQKLWQAEIERYGGLYILARSLAEAIVPVCQALELQYVVEG